MNKEGYGLDWKGRWKRGKGYGAREKRDMETRYLTQARACYN